MAEVLDASSALESTTVGVYRTAATIKGGRRFSFSAMVVVGDRSGRVGVGYGKANQVPPAIEKAQKDAKRRMQPFPMLGRTIPHEVMGRFGSCTVRMIPASPGTGVIAGAPVRAPLEMMGVQDCLTKSFGSNNSKNLVKAVINGLEKLRSKEWVEELRGVKLGATAIEDAVRRGEAFLAPSPAAPAADKPAPETKSKAPRGRKRGEGRPAAKGPDTPALDQTRQPAQGEGRPAAKGPDTAAQAGPEKTAPQADRPEVGADGNAKGDAESGTEEGSSS